MKVCFFGVGGVGGYYGALLTRYFDSTGTGRTYFIARGRHGAAIVERGLTLKKDGGGAEIRVTPFACSNTVAGLPVCDMIVVSVKGYDLDAATEQVAAITDDRTIVLPLLNSADIYERMRRRLDKGCIFASCLYLGTHIESPGVIFQMGGSGQIAIGRDPLYPDIYPEKLIELFRNAGILIEFHEDVNVEIWKKYIFIAPFALVTAAWSKTIGEVAADARLARLVRDIMKEIAAIAKALGIELPPDIVETSFLKAGQFPFETKTSFQRDVETKGRQSEWDLFGGTVIRYADKLGVPAENTRATLEQLLKGLK